MTIENEATRPEVDETDLLPTKKPHTSFSELIVHEECSWKHMLRYIKEVGIDNGNIHTVYGHLVHSNIEAYLREGTLPMATEEAISEHRFKFEEELKLTGTEPKQSDIDSYFEAAVVALKAFPDWFKNEFPDAEVVGVEIPLYEPVPDLKNRFFKGYIDCLLKIPKKPRKNSKKPVEGHYYMVIDWKGQRLSAPILTPSGWTTMGELKIGQEIVGSDGQPTKVNGIYPLGEREVYRVVFRDKTFVDCTDDHLWQVHSANGTKSKVMTTKELISEKEYVFVPVLTNPVEYNVHVDLKIEPYKLGLLLGGASFSQKGSITLHTNDEEILNEFRNCTGYNKKKNQTNNIPLKGYRKLIRECGLEGLDSQNKFIPNEYFLSSPDERHALLQGLLDINGWIQKGIAKYSTTSLKLAQGVRDLVHSLGGVSFMSTRPIRSRANFQEHIVTVRLPSNLPPFRLERKLREWNPNQKHKLQKKISKIEIVGKDQMQCIRVEAKDSLYVTNDFILTHNTTSWGWTVDKKRDFNKQKQLAYYKHYISQKYNVPYSDIKCAFVLIKRSFKEKGPFEVVPVSLGEGSITKAMDGLKRHLNILNKNLFLKNRNSCKYCEFKGTKHCT